MQKGGREKVEEWEKNIPMKHESHLSVASWIHCGDLTHKLFRLHQLSPKTPKCQADCRKSLSDLQIGPGSYELIRPTSGVSQKYPHGGVIWFWPSPSRLVCLPS